MVTARYGMLEYCKETSFFFLKAKQLRLPANHPDLQPHATHVTAGEEKQTMTDEKGDHDRHVTFKEEVIS